MKWQNIIQDLVKNGYSQQGIGDEVGLSQVSISDLYTGKTKSTNYTAGEKLVALHKRVTEQPA